MLHSPENLRSDFRLGPAEKADARAALVLLSGTGLSLTEAARRALLADSVAGRAAALKTVKFADAVRGFLADRHAKQRRGATLEYYENNLGRFAASKLAEDWQRLDGLKIKRWIEGLPQGRTIKAMSFRCLHSLYRWAAQQRPALVHKVPTEGLHLGGDRQQGDQVAPVFYPVAEVERLFQVIGADLLPALAVQLFAGLRPEEVAPRMPEKARIEWSAFLFAEKIVRVPAEVAKSRRARLIEGLPDTLWRWLEMVPAEKRRGPLWPLSEQAYRLQLKTRLRRADVAWLRDGFRHTFATYAVALTSDAKKVSLWLGHTDSDVLHQHYRGLATHAQASAFFDIGTAYPPAPVAVPVKARARRKASSG